MKPLKLLSLLFGLELLANSVFAFPFILNGMVFSVKDSLPVTDHSVYFRMLNDPTLSETLTDSMGRFSITVEPVDSFSYVIELFTVDPCSNDTVYRYHYPYMSSNFVVFNVCGNGNDPVSCQADFSYLNQSWSDGPIDTIPYDSLTFYFFDTSTGHPNSWNWNFGDGTTSVEPNPVHTYSQPGVYDVSLAISTSICQSSITKEVFAGNTTTDCKADFWYQIQGYSDTVINSDGTTTIGDALTVEFFDVSWGYPDSWFWKFGDGTYSSEKNPVHTFPSPGDYMVSLAINSVGCYSGTEQMVSVGNSYPDCMALFGYDYYNWNDSVWIEDTLNTDYLTLYFYDYSYGNPSNWSWDFGDGFTSIQQNPSHTYAVSGEYWVSLSIASDSCQSSYGMPVWVGDFPVDTIWEPTGCMAMFVPELLGNYVVEFHNLSFGGYNETYWDFGDGTGSSYENPVHPYMQDGNYLVTLTISSPDSCMSTFSMEVYVDNQSDSSAIKALFYPEILDNMVKFHNMSEGNIQNWYWDFGDGTSVREPNPVHYYQQKGVYIVTLGAGNASEICTYTMQIDLETGIYKGYFNGATNIDDNQNSNQLKVYPVPFIDNLNIYYRTSKMGSVTVQVTDISGKIVSNENIFCIAGENHLQLSTENWGPGVYILSVVNGIEPTKRLKLIK